MQIVPYHPALKTLWDKAIYLSRNGTFLFQRDYMDYHRNRYEDCSLLFLNERNGVIGCLPANINREQRIVYSHGGLTYGGFVLSKDASYENVWEMFNLAKVYYKHQGGIQLLYKPIPYIYYRYPSEEELYALYRLNAQLIGRGLSSVVDRRVPLPLSQLRKRGVKKALKNKLIINTYEQVDISLVHASMTEFWQILIQVLRQYHQTSPVHTIDEIIYLQSRFPETIRLFTVSTPTTHQIVAGCIAYVTPTVVHIQYIASNDEGRSIGALDFLFNYLLQDYFLTHPYFDFGISTEHQGAYLNAGLLFQKQGFGARGVCYDCYKIDL